MNNQPWECPRCNTIYAPWMPSCTCKPKSILEENGTHFVPNYAKCNICNGYHGNGLDCTLVMINGE